MKTMYAVVGSQQVDGGNLYIDYTLCVVDDEDTANKIVEVLNSIKPCDLHVDDKGYVIRDDYLDCNTQTWKIIHAITGCDDNKELNKLSLAEYAPDKKFDSPWGDYKVVDIVIPTLDDIQPKLDRIKEAYDKIAIKGDS